MSQEQIPVYYRRPLADEAWSWQGFTRAIGDFVAAVDWSQPWLLLLMSFHVISFLSILVVRRDANALTILMGVLGFLLALSQPLNMLARNNWELFASANYFGENGFFVAMTYSLPLSFNFVLVLVMLLMRVVDLLVRVKRIEVIQQRARTERRTSKKNS